MSDTVAKARNKAKKHSEAMWAVKRITATGETYFPLTAFCRMKCDAVAEAEDLAQFRGKAVAVKVRVTEI